MVQISKFLVGQKMQCLEFENLQKYFQYIAANLKCLIESLVLSYDLLGVFLDNLKTFLLVFFINLPILPLGALKSTDMRSQPLCTSKHHC